MKKDDIFGDYFPKESEDTAGDYLAGTEEASQYAAAVSALPQAELKNLTQLCNAFATYAQRAKKNPGMYEEGNMLLGADTREYRPSVDELILADIGDRIKAIVTTTPKEKLKQYCAEQKTTVKKIEYPSFTFRHADVMGSGRFFYASEPKKEVVSFG